MVVFLHRSVTLLAQEAPSPERLPEPTRTILLMALLGIILLGLLIVAITLLGGRWVRRWGEHRPGVGIPPDLILKRPDSPPQDRSVSDANQSETVGGE